MQDAACSMRHAAARARRRLALSVIDDSGLAPRLDRRALRRVLGLALAGAGAGVVALTVRLVDDAESKRLHGAFFHDPSPTDVMTFPDGGCDPDGRVRLGDLAVGVAVARREAAARGRREADELLLYALHGLLHLLGYDDRTPRLRRAMWARQRELLAQVGIALEAAP